MAEGTGEGAGGSEEERQEAERAETERVEAERRAAEGGGESGGDTELAAALAEQERLQEENTALAEQNRELLGGLTDEGDLGEQLAEERAERVKLQGEVEEMKRGTAVERARAAILKEQPELEGHEDLIGEDDPEKMRERAKRLKDFSTEQLAASRTAVEKEVAAKFGVPLGSSAEGAVAPEEQEARQKAIDDGDAEAVAGQVVESNVEKLI